MTKPLSSHYNGRKPKIMHTFAFMRHANGPSESFQGCNRNMESRGGEKRWHRSEGQCVVPNVPASRSPTYELCLPRSGAVKPAQWSARVPRKG